MYVITCIILLMFDLFWYDEGKCIPNSITCSLIWRSSFFHALIHALVHKGRLLPIPCFADCCLSKPRKNLKDTVMYFDAPAALPHKSTKRKWHETNPGGRTPACPCHSLYTSFVTGTLPSRLHSRRMSQARFAMQFAVPTFCEFPSASAKAALAFSVDKRARCTANKEQDHQPHKMTRPVWFSQHASIILPDSRPRLNVRFGKPPTDCQSLQIKSNTRSQESKLNSAITCNNLCLILPSFAYFFWLGGG